MLFRSIAGLGLVEVVLISYLYGTAKLREEANMYSDFKVGIWWDYLLKYFTPLLLGAVVFTNIFNIVTGLFEADKIGLMSSIIFGWGTVVIMIGVSLVFNKKKWAEHHQLSNQEGN